MIEEYKIGIDFHGVITSAPEIFKRFIKALRNIGVKVYVISGGPKKDVKAYLDERGIDYDEIWAILDYYEKSGDVTYFSDGSYQVPSELWDKAKAKYCAEEHIYFHIDDSNVYGDYFVTPYCCYDLHNEVCHLENMKIDFKQPENTAKLVAELLRNDKFSHNI